MPPPQKPAVPTTGPTTALNAVTGDPFLDGIIQNRLSHMSSTAQGFVDTANTIADVAVGMTNVGSAYEAIVGETITGQELTPFQRGVAGVSVAFAPLAFVARIGGNAVEGAAQAARLPETRWISQSADSIPLGPKTADGTYIYVRNTHGEIRILPETGQHPAVFGGNVPTTGAGELTMKNGQLIQIDNYSGNFKFDGTEINSVIESIRAQGVPVPKTVQIQIFPH